MDLLDKCNFKYLIENKDYHWVNNDSVEVCSKCNGSFGLLVENTIVDIVVI